MAKVSALGQTNKGYTQTNTKPDPKQYLSATEMAAMYGEDFSHRTNPNQTTYVADSGTHTGQALVQPTTTMPTAPVTPTTDSGGGGGGSGGGGSSGSGSPSGSGSGSTTPRADIPLEQAYIPGNDPAYQEALNALNNLTGNTPTYTPSYDDQLAELYNRIIGRGPFQYDLNQDPFYQQYRTQAIDTGRLAMMDSMGQAAALTGGYGSSYGAQVGQQQYDAYLRALNEQVPEFYNSAYNRWLNEGNELESQYNLTRTMANDEYNKYQDQLSDYYRQLDLATDRENTLYNRGRTEAADAANARSDNRDRLLQLMTTTGYQPSEAELEAAGMSPDEAAAWQNYYLASITPSGGGGGGSGSGGGSGNVKLNFKDGQISDALSAYGRGGEAELAAYGGRLALQGYSEDEINALWSYVTNNGAITPPSSSSGSTTSNSPSSATTGINWGTNTINGNLVTGLSSESRPEDVLAYYDWYNDKVVPKRQTK